MNLPPAHAMAAVAATHGAYAMGYVRGSLGGKAFVASKREAADYLKSQPIPTVIVNPSLVYGAGRHNSLTKLVPFLKFAGLFNRRLRPVTVEQVASEMISGLRTIEQQHNCASGDHA